MTTRRGDLGVLCSGAFAAALALAAGDAHAQSGLRTLNWPGKAETARVQPQPAPAQTQTAPESVSLQVQPGVMPDYTAAPPAFPRSLTPATAFGAPALVSGGQAYASNPAIHSSAAYAAVPNAPVQQTPVPSTPTPQTPVVSPRTQPAPSQDPMAPRADAPVWRLMGQNRGESQGEDQGQAASQSQDPQSSAAAAPNDRDGARYYSVHRQAGRAPDPTTLPAPFFLDSVPVDLAEPPPPPTLMRQGGLAPSVADSGL